MIKNFWKFIQAVLTRIFGAKSAKPSTPLTSLENSTTEEHQIVHNDWDTAINFVLKMEGDYTLDPNDPGGETKYGISKKAYPNLDIKNLTVEQAKEIYKKDYWQVCKCDELPTPFAIALFDMGVNMGTKKSIRIMQISLDIDADGIIGDNTITAAFKATRSQLKRFIANRLVEYHRIMDLNTNLNVFALNWFYRTVSLSELIFGKAENGNG